MNDSQSFGNFLKRTGLRFGNFLKRIGLLNPTFLTGVVFLVLASLGLSLVTSGFEWFFKKERVELRRELNTIPEQLGPYELVRSEKVPKVVQEQLYSDKYIYNIYRDTRKAVGEPGSALSFHVIYYTGNQEPVSAAHVPEICYAQGGFKQLGVNQVELDVSFRDTEKVADGRLRTLNKDGSKVYLPGSRIPVREFEFQRPNSSETGSVIYFFFYNGSYISTRNEITFQFLDYNSRKVYYAKVEIAPGVMLEGGFQQGKVGFIPGTESVEQSRELASEFMSWYVPEVKTCLPDDTHFMDIDETLKMDN